MIDWNKYEQRMISQGNSIREIRLNRAKYHLNKYGINNPSYKDVIINGIEKKLAINSGSKPYYKKFHTLPDETIYPGQLIQWNETVWLVINADFDNEFYVDGNLQQCNYKLKWQNKNNEIVERDVVVLSSSNGVDDKSLITLGHDQLMIYISYDEETIELKRDKRFFISNNKNNPLPFKLISVNTTSNVYNGHGYLELIVSEDVSQDDDNIELGICNYTNSNSTDTPTSDSTAKIVYKSLKLISGYSKGATYTAEFYFQDVKQSNVSPTWFISCPFKDKLVIKETGDKITILINDDSYIGQRINLTLKDSEGIYLEDSIIIEVGGLF